MRFALLFALTLALTACADDDTAPTSDASDVLEVDTSDWCTSDLECPSFDYCHIETGLCVIPTIRCDETPCPESHPVCVDGRCRP